MAMEIETSTDTVEQVKEALGAGVEIEDSSEAATPTEEQDPETPAEEAEAEAGATAEETETEEHSEEAEEGKGKKPAPKAPAKAPVLVPRSRLNQEIQRRKDAETALAAEKAKPPVKETPVEETPDEPQTFSGIAEPKIEDFLGNEKYPDPYAAFTRVHGEWVRKETLAEVDQNKRVEAETAKHNERVAAFKANLKEAKETRLTDYDDVVNGSQVQISTFMERRVYKSKVGPDCLYYYVTNPEEAARIMALDVDDQAIAVVELEARIAADIKAGKVASPPEEEAEEAAAPGKQIPKKEIPRKPKGSQAPIPPNRIKPAGPGPKTLQELAGPEDRTGVDLDFNPEYERAVKAGRKT